MDCSCWAAKAPGISRSSWSRVGREAGGRERDKILGKAWRRPQVSPGGDETPLGLFFFWNSEGSNADATTPCPGAGKHTEGGWAWETPWGRLCLGDSRGKSWKVPQDSENPAWCHPGVGLGWRNPIPRDLEGPWRCSPSLAVTLRVTLTLNFAVPPSQRCGV